MITANDIIDKVAKIYSITVDDMTSKKRHRVYADARAVVCYVLCSLRFCTFSEVARLLHKSHATVIYHNHRACDWMQTPRINPRGYNVIREIEREYIN